MSQQKLYLYKILLNVGSILLYFLLFYGYFLRRLLSLNNSVAFLGHPSILLWGWDACWGSACGVMNLNLFIKLRESSAWQLDLKTKWDWSNPGILFFIVEIIITSFPTSVTSLRALLYDPSVLYFKCVTSKILIFLRYQSLDLTVMNRSVKWGKLRKIKEMKTKALLSLSFTLQRDKYKETVKTVLKTRHICLI